VGGKLAMREVESGEFMPASISCFITSGDSEAGPIVQTIFVFGEVIFIISLRAKNDSFTIRFRKVTTAAQLCG